MHSKWTLFGCYKLLGFMWKLIQTPFRLLFRFIPEFRHVYRTSAEVDEGRVDVRRTENKIIVDKKDVVEVKTDNPKEECPEFQEIIEIDKEMIIGIEKIIRTPDETALIRIVNNDSFSKQFKRRVYTIKGTRCIKMDGKRYFLEKTKVQLD